MSRGHLVDIDSEIWTFTDIFKCTSSVFTEIKKIKYGGQQLLNIAFQR